MGKDRKQKKERAVDPIRGDYCVITDPPLTGTGAIPIRVIPSTKVFSAEGYVKDPKLIDSVVVEDQVIGTETTGQSLDAVTFTASAISTDYGKRVCVATCAFTTTNPDTDIDSRTFLAMPQQLTFTIQNVTNPGGGCTSCTKANRTFTLSYNTVVSNAWGEQLTSSPDNRICFCGCVRLDVISTSDTEGTVNLRIKSTFSAPTQLVRYVNDHWNYTFPIELTKDGNTGASCPSLPATISVSPV